MSDSVIETSLPLAMRSVFLRETCSTMQQKGALTLRVSSIRLSALIQVASSSLASSGENTSGGTCQEFVRTRRSRPARGKNPGGAEGDEPAAATFVPNDQVK
jgi:hypothetical protein